MGNHSLALARTQSKPQIHPIWMLLALPSMLLLLFSDAGNNLSIVHRFASGELSLLSWQGLALGAAVASAPLGYASGSKKWMIVPTAIVCIIGGVLTLMSTNTDFKGKSVDAHKYQADFAALEAERANLIASLSPSDGALPCSKQRWCDSQAKEQRLAQINTMTNFVDTAVDPLATPGGQFFSQLLAWLRAFGVPVVVASLAHCLGLMFHGNFQKHGYATGPIGRGSFQEKKSSKSCETSTEKAVELAKQWLQEQSSGRISKEKLKIACKVRGHKKTARIIELLIISGELIRYDNGQLAKPDNKSLRVVR